MSHSHEVKAFLTLSKDEILANWEGLFDDIEDYTKKEVKSILTHLIDLKIDFKDIVYIFTSPKHVKTFVKTLHFNGYSENEIVSLILGEGVNDKIFPTTYLVAFYVSSVIAMCKEYSNPHLIFPEAKLK